MSQTPDPLDFLDLDHLLSEEERLIRDTTRGFVADRILPEVAGWFERGHLELLHDAVADDPPIEGLGSLPAQVDGAPGGGHHGVGEPGRGGQPRGVHHPVGGGHRPFQVGERPSVKAAENSRWSSEVISRAWVTASSSRAPDSGRSSSRVSRTLVAA